eukprot:m.601412 g.601412  ORF g.601412 m.601412 type:complete len:122 (-) comp22441_c0_seq12:42-407(-)
MWTVASFLPNMYICSNTDLSGTGASVLQHRHYQIVSKRLPICDAQSQFACSFGSATVEFLSFPCAAVRVRAASHTSSDKDASTAQFDCVDAVVKLLDAWRSVEVPFVRPSRAVSCNCVADP